MDPNLPFQPPAPAEPIQPIVPAMPPMESVPVLPPTKKTNWILILGIVLLLVSVLALVGYYLYQSNQLRVSVSTPIALSSLSPIATSDPTANWQTYTNSQFGFSFSYPTTWKDITSAETVKQGNREFRVLTNGGEYINGTVVDKFDTIQTDQSWSKQIKLNSGKAVLITYTDNLGPGSKGGEKDIEIFNQILSTFKFTEVSPSPSSTPSSTPSATPTATPL